MHQTKQFDQTMTNLQQYLKITKSEKRHFLLENEKGSIQYSDVKLPRLGLELN